jgi:fructose-bisphosphate aldolase class II
MITLNEALGDAQRKRIAIGHFNVSDLVALKAVTGAARALKVPVLVGTSEGERDFIGVREIVAVVASLRAELDHPIFLNADHTHSLEHAVEAAKAGYDMIGFDVSSRTEGQVIHEKTTVSSSLRLTAIGKDVVAPSGTSLPQHSTTFTAPCSLKTTAAASACFL